MTNILEIEDNTLVTSLDLSNEHLSNIEWYLTKFSPEINKIIVTSKLHTYAYDESKNELSIGKLFLQNTIKQVAESSNGKIKDVFSSKNEENFELLKTPFSNNLPDSLVNGSAYKVTIQRDQHIIKINTESNLSDKLLIYFLVIVDLLILFFYASIAIDYFSMNDFGAIFTDVRAWILVGLFLSISKILLNKADEL